MTLALANGPQVFPEGLTQFLAFEALDVLAVGIIFANANSGILHANRAARDIAAQDDGLYLHLPSGAHAAKTLYPGTLGAEDDIS